MSEWQPIETAPLGWLILVGSPDQVIDGVFYEDNVAPCVVQKNDIRGVFYEDVSDCEGHGTYGEVWPSPTHWMPLPDPPHTGTGGGDATAATTVD